jgi:hypothetical protein
MSSSDGFFCVYKVPLSNRGNLSKTLFCFPTVMCSSSMLKHFLKKNHVIFSLPLVNRFNDWVLWQSFHASFDIFVFQNSSALSLRHLSQCIAAIASDWGVQG